LQLIILNVGYSLNGRIVSIVSSLTPAG